MSTIYRMLSLAMKWVKMVKISPRQIPTFMTKIVFSDNVEWSSKNLWKMMSAGVKCNTKQIKDLVAVSYKFFLRSTLKSWEIQCKKVVFFIWFWLVFHPSWYCPLRTGGRGLLNRQNLLSMTKAICRQSLGH